MKFTRTIAAAIFVLAAAVAHAQFHTNRAEIKHQVFHSKVLNEDRSIVTYKPETFPAFKDVNMPVLYVMDGDLFADIFVAYVNLYAQKFSDLPPIMVVGVGNVELRNRDYTPEKAKEKDAKENAGADKFMEFLTKELMPEIEKDHAKKPYRIIAGHSLGGLMVMHAFTHYPDVFQAAIASSPHLAGNNNSYMTELTEYLLKPRGPRWPAGERSLFFSIGNEGRQYLPNARHLDSLLTHKNVPGLQHKFIHFPDEDHGTVLPKSTYEGFKFTFHLDRTMSDQPFPENYSIIENRFRAMSQIFGYTMSYESALNSLGYQYLYDWKKPDQAIECFKKNVELNPNSGNAYDSYAEAFMVKGDKKNAILYYEKSLSLDPKNDNARQTLAKLRQ